MKGFLRGCIDAHGLRRSNEDKRKCVKILLMDEEWSQMSSTEIAGYCMVSVPFVADVRKNLTINVNSENLATRTYVTKHGTVAQMNTSRIGKRAPAERCKVSPNLVRQMKKDSLTTVVSEEGYSGIPEYEIRLEDEEWGKWSDREIARCCKVHHDMVGELRKAYLSDSARCEERKVRRGNSEYVQNTSRIGKRAPAEPPSEPAEPPREPKAETG